MTTNETNVLNTTNETNVLDTTNETSLIVTDTKKEKKVLSQREITSQRQKNTQNSFDFVSVFDSKINEKLKNYTILQMCNVLELIKMSFITDLLYLNNFMSQVFKIFYEIVEFENLTDKTTTKLRDVLLSYKVNKIENVEESRKLILEIYKKFSNIDKSKITIENFEILLSEYNTLRKLNSQDEEKFRKYLTVNKVVSSCFLYNNKSLSYYTSSKTDTTENFYNIFTMFTDYNIVRNIHIIHELYKTFCKNVTTHKHKTEEQKVVELNLLKKSYVVYFTKEQMLETYDANYVNEVKRCKTTYLENFKKFHKSDKYENFVTERSEMNYIFQLEKLIEENFELFNTSEFIFYMNNNRENLITVK